MIVANDHVERSTLDPLNKALSQENTGRLLKRVMRLFDQQLRARLSDLGYDDDRPRVVVLVAAEV